MGEAAGLEPTTPTNQIKGEKRAGTRNLTPRPCSTELLDVVSAWEQLAAWEAETKIQDAMPDVLAATGVREVGDHSAGVG